MEPLLGNVGLDIKLNLNQQTRGGSLWGRVEGYIGHIDFKNYTYQNIVVSGNYNDTNYDGIISINDPNGQMQLIGTIDLFNERPVIRVLAEGNNIRLGRLNLAPKYSESTTSFNVTSNFYGDHIDNIEGEIVIDTLSFENKGKLFSTGKFTVIAENRDSLKNLQIKSDFINGNIEGKYSFRQIKRHFTELLSLYLPDAVSSPDSTGTGQNNFRYAFDLSNSIELSSAFELPVTLQKDVLVSGHFDAESHNMSLQIDAPELKIKTKRLLNNEIRLHTNDSALIFSAHTGMLNKKGQFTGWAFNTAAGNNHISSRIGATTAIRLSAVR